MAVVGFGPLPHSTGLQLRPFPSCPPRAGHHPRQERDRRSAEAYGALARRARVVRRGPLAPSRARPRSDGAQRCARRPGSLRGRSGGLDGPLAWFCHSTSYPRPRGGAWEEPGWRGFALPRLQAGRSALFAALILGVLIAGWHVPLMVVGEVHWSDIVLIIGAVIIFNWVFNNANGSVLIIMMMHAMNNTISGQFFSPMFSGADSVRQSWMLAAVWCAVAIVVVILAGPAHLSRTHKKQEEKWAEEPSATTPTAPPVPRPT